MTFDKLLWDFPGDRRDTNFLGIYPRKWYEPFRDKVLQEAILL